MSGFRAGFATSGVIVFVLGIVIGDGVLIGCGWGYLGATLIPWALERRGQRQELAGDELVERLALRLWYDFPSSGPKLVPWRLRHARRLIADFGLRAYPAEARPSTVESTPANPGEAPNQEPLA